MDNNEAIFYHEGKSVKIKGDSAFITRTRYALMLLKQYYNHGLQIVLCYVNIIEQSEYSGITNMEYCPTFKVGDRTSSADITWYASCILHDSYHSKLFRDARNAGKTYSQSYGEASGEKAEYKCLEEQIKALNAMPTPQYVLEHAKKCRNSRWWENKKRDW